MKDFFIGLMAVIILLNLIFIICCIKNEKDKED